MKYINWTLVFPLFVLAFVAGAAPSVATNYLDLKFAHDFPEPSYQTTVSPKPSPRQKGTVTRTISVYSDYNPNDPTVVFYDFYSGMGASEIINWEPRTPSFEPGHPYTSIERGEPAIEPVATPDPKDERIAYLERALEQAQLVGAFRLADDGVWSEFDNSQPRDAVPDLARYLQEKQK